MKKIAVIIVIVFGTLLFNSYETNAYVTPEDRPADIFNVNFSVFEIVDIGLNNALNNDYYISVYDLEGNFIGGNYYNNLRGSASIYENTVTLHEDQDYVAKIEGEGIQTRYQVFNVKLYSSKGFTDTLYVSSAYSEIGRPISYTLYQPAFEHDIQLVKDGRDVASKQKVSYYDLTVMQGRYQLGIGSKSTFDLMINPGQKVSFFPLVQNYLPTIEFKIGSYDNVKVYDEEGYIVYDYKSSTVPRDVNIQPGNYMVHYEDEKIPYVVDELEGDRELDVKGTTHFEPGVKFDLISSLGHKDMPAIKLTITDADGTEIVKYRDYQGDIINLPHVGKYKVAVEGEGYYPYETTFTYNDEREFIHFKLYLLDQIEQVEVSLLNSSNINVASAQVELQNNVTGELHYGLNGTDERKWTVKNLEPGTYTLRFKASGYYTFEREVIIHKASQVNVPVFLTEYHPWYDRHEPFQEAKVVPKNKQWNIHFTKPVNPRRVNNDAIYVTDGNGIRLNDVELVVSNDGKTITVKRNSDYTSGSRYYLYVSATLKDYTDKQSIRDTMMQFIIE